MIRICICDDKRMERKKLQEYATLFLKEHPKLRGRDRSVFFRGGGIKGD